MNIHYRAYPLKNTDLIFYEIIPLDHQEDLHTDFILSNIVPVSSFQNLIDNFNIEHRHKFYHQDYLSCYYFTQRDKLALLREHQLFWKLFLHQTVSCKNNIDRIINLCADEQQELILIPDQNLELVLSAYHLIESQCLYFSPVLCLPPANHSIWKKRDQYCLIDHQIKNTIEEELGLFFIRQLNTHQEHFSLGFQHPFMFDVRNHGAYGFDTDKDILLSLPFKVNTSLFQPLWEKYIHFFKESQSFYYMSYYGHEYISSYPEYFLFSFLAEKGDEPYSLTFMSLLAFNVSDLKPLLHLEPLALYRFLYRDDVLDNKIVLQEPLVQEQHNFEIKIRTWKNNYLQHLLLHDNLPILQHHHSQPKI